MSTGEEGVVDGVKSVIIGGETNQQNQVNLGICDQRTETESEPLQKQPEVEDSSPDFVGEDLSLKPRYMAGQIKKTCESCVRSKVKCDGRKPCERCLKRGCECVYLLEQKRGRRMGSKQVSSKRLNAEEVSDNPSTMHQDVQLRLLQQRLLGGSAGYPMNFSPPSVDGRISGMGIPQSTVARNGSALPFPFQTQPFQTAASPSFLQASNGFSRNVLQFSSNQISFIPKQMPLHRASMNFPGATQSITDFTESERRMVRVLLALYRYHKVGEFDENRHKWFEARFLILMALLSKKYSSVRDLFFKWCAKNSLTLEDTANKLYRSLCTDALSLSSVPFPNSSGLQVSAKSAFLGSVYILPSGKIECNEVFIQNIGFAAKEIMSTLSHPGFFPWGGDVISAIAVNDDDVLTYIRSMGHALNVMNVKDAFTRPAVCEVPLSIRHKGGIQVDCVVHAEILVAGTLDASSCPGVTMQFYLAAPELVLLPKTRADLGPWPIQGDDDSWLSKLLSWTDAAI
jgi:hypothetical protein